MFEVPKSKNMYDIFNGDADGILSALQMQLYRPINSIKITGVKRDIELLSKASPQSGDIIRVFDVSMHKNKRALNKSIEVGASIFYFDHHKSGDVPKSANLTSYINTNPNTCTSLIVSKILNKKYHTWAICAAYGDNLFKTAEAEAEKLKIKFKEKNLLKLLGTYLNYNSYGRDIQDLYIHPKELLLELMKYEDPIEIVQKKDSIFYELEERYNQDMLNTSSANIIHECNTCMVVELENTAWARRISGIYSNKLTNENPDRAHAVLTRNDDSTFMVSIRAPLNNKQGAIRIADQFPTGGGREAAAGINVLGHDKVSALIKMLIDVYK